MSTLRDTYPVQINSTDLFRPEKWDVAKAVVETEFTTEAGTDTSIVARYGKTTISAEYACDDSWLATFQGWSETNSLTVKYYDPTVPGYATKTMRMRNFKYSLVPHSDYITESLGLYTVSFDLIEF